MQRKMKHGAAIRGRKTREYSIWDCMKKRCTNPNHNRFHRYGGRGIKVCERWMNFENFIADMGIAPAGYSIDRINNDGDYEPGNCRWASSKTQIQNKSGKSFGVVTINGVSKLISEWLKETGVSYNAYWIRKTRRGWDEEKAIFTPAREIKKRQPGDSPGQ